MNHDFKSGWQHLKSELQHWGGARVDDLDWIDFAYDYPRGRSTVHHAPRADRSDVHASHASSRRR